MQHIGTPIRLTTDDIARYITIRRHMLETEPHAFGSHPDTDGALNPDTLRQRITSNTNAIFATADDTGQLTATAAVFRELSPKTIHRANIVAVFTHPEHRGQGLAKACVTAALDHAKAWPEAKVINLSVSPEAPAAKCLYESLGFTQWGIEPNALQVGDTCHDEIHMQLVLR